MRSSLFRRNLFFAGIILAASGILSAPLALAAGLVFGMFLLHPFPEESQDLTKFLLPASVVLLGFGMNVYQVIQAGRSGFLYTAVSITGALLLGFLLGKAMRVHPGASFLITCGTAICGGSAIAALAPITEASEEDIAVSLGTVFTLNSAALLIFPLVGYALHLTQSQFGLWAALAIHDTSSVVGAAAKYGPDALVIGTTVKLTRALWIIPLAFATAYVVKSGGRVRMPWFILYFCLAAVAGTFLPAFAPQFATLNQLGKTGLAVTLFLIGTSISPKMLRQVGVRPMIQGVALWVVVAVVSLLAIHSGLIGI